MQKTIVVGTDGSDAAQYALEYAVELARGADTTLHVVTVIDPTGSPLRFGVGDVDDLNQAKTALLEDLEAVDAAVDSTIAVRRGDPPTVLLEYASEVEADCIVVGQCGAGQLEATLLGSTAEELTRETTLPLTIVPSPDTKDRCENRY